MYTPIARVPVPRPELLALTMLWLLPGTMQAQAPDLFRACYVPKAGIVYRIGVPEAPAACRSDGHVEFSWTDGVEGHEHHNLTGLADDDHPEYVRAGEAAGGDLGGTYPDPSVVGLQGNAVSTATPSEGQLLSWDATAGHWTPGAGVGVGQSCPTGEFVSGIDADGNVICAPPPSGDGDVVENSAPTEGGVALVPDPADSDDNLICTSTGFGDPDGDPVTLSYRWFVDGAELTSRTSAVLGEDFTREDQTVVCEVRASDPDGLFSDWVASQQVLITGPEVCGDGIDNDGDGVVDESECI